MDIQNNLKKILIIFFSILIILLISLYFIYKYKYLNNDINEDNNIIKNKIKKTETEKQKDLLNKLNKNKIKTKNEIKKNISLLEQLNKKNIKKNSSLKQEKLLRKLR